MFVAAYPVHITYVRSTCTVSTGQCKIMGDDDPAVGVCLPSTGDGDDLEGVNEPFETSFHDGGTGIL